MCYIFPCTARAGGHCRAPLWCHKLWRCAAGQSACHSLLSWGYGYGFGYGQQSGGLIGSRLVAVAGAIITTFLLNARYTFGASIRRARLTRYVLIQVLGAALNIGTFTVLVLGPLNRPLIALALGSAVATVSNFVLVRRYVYDWR